MTSKTTMTYQDFWHRLVPLYGDGEAKAIARMVYEERFGLTLSDLLMGRDAEVALSELEPLVARLERGEPVQYVLGVARFCGYSFQVAPGVLIPRPETEWLCRYITHHPSPITHHPSPTTHHPTAILDIGTGSGCIACTLALQLSGAKITAWDLSTKALRIARQNAERLGAEVNFVQQDALQPPTDCEAWDVIVSNPPYVCLSERATMLPNVLDHEPHEALFVPDDDALVFYRCIGRYALRALKRGGLLAMELNERLGLETCRLMEDIGLKDVCLHRDEFGRDRYLAATSYLEPRTSHLDSYQVII